ncbi:hypothetical protein [Photobacterium leiognathi]|uniref:hypothetical protein n=1 Tax=Photobacterium leiognathi TaxID=553611 RepID=UPI00280B51D9|nr:hypothetical protein [Photobacterium leiognathi]
MKHYKQWLFAASLSIIAGCNSGSSSSETKTVTRVKPAADYNFNDEEIAKLVNDREKYRNSLDLSFDGTIYHHVKFAQQMSDELMVVKLADNYDHDIDLMMTQDVLFIKKTNTKKFLIVVSLINP